MEGTNRTEHILLTNEVIDYTSSQSQDCAYISEDSNSQDRYALRRAPKRRKDTNEGAEHPRKSKKTVVEIDDSNSGNSTRVRIPAAAVSPSFAGLIPGVRVKVEQSSSTQPTQSVSWRISDVIAPSSCSLYSAITVRWSFSYQGSLHQNLNNNNNDKVERIQLSKVASPFGKTNEINGIWLQFRNLPSTISTQNDTFLYIQLFEQSVKNSEAESVAEFCDKCRRKRSEVVQLNQSTVDSLRPTTSNKSQREFQFEGSFSINEQCAHRSKNPYGAPTTAFLLKLQIFERPQGAEENSRVLHSAPGRSGHIKVVAQGKNKAAQQPAPAIATSHSSTTTQKTVSSSETPVEVKQESAKFIKSRNFIEMICAHQNKIFKTMEALQDRIETLQGEVNHYKDRTNELEVQLQQIRNEHRHCLQNPQQNSENVADVVEPFPTELISSLLEGLQESSFMGQFSMIAEGQEERSVTLSLTEQTALLATASSSPSSVAVASANDKVSSPVHSPFFDLFNL